MDALEKLGYVKTDEVGIMVVYQLDRKETHDYHIRLTLDTRRGAVRKAISHGGKPQEPAYLNKKELKAIRKILKEIKNTSKSAQSPTMDSVGVLGYILDNRHVASIPRNNIDGAILNELCSPLLAIGIRLDWDQQLIYFKAL